MAELTLESLAKRVEALEQIVAAQQRRERKIVITPGTGDWEAVAEGLKQLKDYDFDAVPDMDALSIEDMRRTEERMK